MLKTSTEDYLRTIYAIYESQRDKSDGIKSADISRRLSVSRPSVSEMMCKLKQQGFVKRERYGTVFFTSKGLKVAKEVMHNHRIIELLLTKILGYDIDLEKKQLHEEAHRLEHAFSKESLHRIDKFLNNPKIMPTGKNIPH